MNKITPSVTPRFAVCIRNDEYPVALKLNKVYQVLPDAYAESIGWLRVVDESGEDYLYPGSFFQLIEVPHTMEDPCCARSESITGVSEASRAMIVRLASFPRLTPREGTRLAASPAG